MVAMNKAACDLPVRVSERWPMDLWISGAGGAALEAWAVIDALEGGPGDHHLAGFISLEGAPQIPTGGLPCLAETAFLARVSPRNAQVVLAIGNVEARCRREKLFKDAGFHFATLIHPSAVVGRDVTIGAGSIVMAGAILETQLDIGRHCLVNVLASVAHGCQVGDFCNLGPGVHLAGDVRVGDRSDLGTGCVCLPGVRLGPGMVIGAGAVVKDNWTQNLTLVGVPARPVYRP
jgi:sugar O-acyltransferase (sialic acid O-acetyltransferase NeuD family)